MKLCGFEVGLDQPFFLIAGPCVIESEQLAIDTAGYLKELTGKLNIPFIYKSSFDKANRTSHLSFRGPGLSKGLEVLAEVKARFGVPILVDVHQIVRSLAGAVLVDEHVGHKFTIEQVAGHLGRSVAPGSCSSTGWRRPTA